MLIVLWMRVRMREWMIEVEIGWMRMNEEAVGRYCIVLSFLYFYTFNEIPRFLVR